MRAHVEIEPATTGEGFVIRRDGVEKVWAGSDRVVYITSTWHYRFTTFEGARDFCWLLELTWSIRASPP